MNKDAVPGLAGADCVMCSQRPRAKDGPADGGGTGADGTVRLPLSLLEMLVVRLTLSPTVCTVGKTLRVRVPLYRWGVIIKPPKLGDRKRQSVSSHGCHGDVCPGEDAWLHLHVLPVLFAFLGTWSGYYLIKPQVPEP